MKILTGSDLARAVKLFHGPGKWTDDRQAEWNRLTGQTDGTGAAMPSVLFEMADAVLEGEVRSNLASRTVTP